MISRYNFGLSVSVTVAIALSVLIGAVMCAARGHGHDDSHDDDHHSRRSGRHFPGHTDHYDGDEHNPDYDHESILGSQDAVEDFHHLEPEEAKKRLSVLVDRMDKDGDKSVSKDELISWIVDSFHKIDLEDGKSRFKELDSDTSNSISWAEVVKAEFGYTLEQLAAHEKDDSSDLKDIKKSLEQERQKFQLADVDGNGDLDISEFAAFLTPSGYAHMAPFILDEARTEHDRNNDKVVDFEEFRNRGEEDEDSDELKQSDKTQFDQYDVDKDGVLNEKEMQAWFMPSYNSIAGEEADHLIKTADTNGDGILQREEILDAHETFVGSQATEYGDLLKKEEL